MLYHHGLDSTIGYEPIGMATKATRKERGIWVEAELSKAHAYHEAIAMMLGEEMLGYSSGAHPRSVAKTADGMITNWFWHEQSLTPVPANPFSMISVKSGRALLPFKTMASILDKLGRMPKDPAEAEELALPHIEEIDGLKALRERVALLEGKTTNEPPVRAVDKGKLYAIKLRHYKLFAEAL